MDRSKKVEQVVSSLRSAGCRVTPQRLAVVQVVLSDPSHPTADQVFQQVREQFPTTSLGTVYKTLDLLETLGVVHAISTRDGARFDGYRHGEHAHLVCTSCGRTFDLDAPGAKGLAERLSGETGHLISSDGMVFRGKCSHCLDLD